MITSNFTNSLLKRLRYGTPNPTRDWFVLVTLSSIIFIGIVVWNIWAFDTVAQGGVIGSAPVNSQPVFNRSSLDTIHTIFANRAAEEAKYETDVYHFADPSQ